MPKHVRQQSKSLFVKLTKIIDSTLIDGTQDLKKKQNHMLDLKSSFVDFIQEISSKC